MAYSKTHRIQIFHAMFFVESIKISSRISKIPKFLTLQNCCFNLNHNKAFKNCLAIQSKAPKMDILLHLIQTMECYLPRWAWNWMNQQHSLKRISRCCKPVAGQHKVPASFASLASGRNRLLPEILCCITIYNFPSVRIIITLSVNKVAPLCSKRLLQFVPSCPTLC